MPLPRLFTKIVSWLVLIGLAARVHAAEPVWDPAEWNGEKALTSVSQGWKAVVSLERGRLMFFGPADGAVNLILAPVSRDNPNLQGGHRLWLGPQATWAAIWPPPKQWEMSGPESFTTDGGVLRMLMPDAGDGWPRLTRTYKWDGAQLICGAEMQGGTRTAQFVQIIQVPGETLVEAEARPDTIAPSGYVLLPAATVTKLMTEFPKVPQVTRAGRSLQFRQTGGIVKLGLRPQTLGGRNPGLTLRVGRGVQSGKVAGAPDQGFFTQVYLGGPEPFIELEQLSPLFVAGGPASFAIVLEGVRR